MDTPVTKVRGAQTYRKRPVTVEALFYDGRNDPDLTLFVPCNILDWDNEGHPWIKSSRGNLRVSAGDYVIHDPKDEFYPCRGDIFGRTYEPFEETTHLPSEFPAEETIARSKASQKNLSFSTALILLKEGRRLTRAGWNGKGMYVVAMPGYVNYPANAATAKAHGLREGDLVIITPYLAMRNAQGQIVPGWLASQTDLLATDWEVLA